MKFNITFTDDIGIDKALTAIANNDAMNAAESKGEMELYEIAKKKRDNLKIRLTRFLKTWVEPLDYKHLECITIQFDTKTNTAIVLPRK